ncbi:hypothetical protein OH76DRAFT_1340540 [Lentinus brumalis]|uniref:Uncharacterized protein n=1 Tax=Lentinus brumalis TaxID=2498619 RepID=A0A371DQ02_9APHY|nr:hypothetical protein OH76DRAFT_1340540 [Polyporus brumalis]
MLATGLKVVWFSLSLTGFLSSIAALPAFAQALDGYLIPGLYTATNLVLQGLFCLGMIWTMDPFEMPRTFCIMQPALSGVAWSFMTVITSCMTFATSYAILRPAGGVPASPAYIRSRLRWHHACLFMAFIPMAAFAAYLVLVLRFDAVQPTDGMNCDATNPVWVRLLSYAGVPLLLALPSLLLTCAAAFQFYIHSSRSPGHTSRSFVHSNDHFTPVPLRRQSKFRLNNGWHEAKGVDMEPYTTGSMPELTPSSTRPGADQRSVTPSGTIVVAEAIPSPPDSLSSARGRMSTGRAPVSPGVAQPGMRYHLPFQWQPPSPRSSTDLFRDSPELSYSRQTPSPLVFAMPADDPKGPNTTMVSVTSNLSERIYEAAPWLKDEKAAYLRQIERANNARKGEITHDDDEHYDAVSGELRWVRNSDDTATVKSELEFARTPQREVFEEVAWRPSPVDPSTYDAGLTETPIPNFTRMVWRILFFQLFSSATQIIATLSSLVDMFTQNKAPSSFGTQHVALILAAWAPPIAFGIIPWRRKAR